MVLRKGSILQETMCGRLPLLYGKQKVENPQDGARRIRQMIRRY